MRYMLAYMIGGEAKDYHRELSDRLAKRFSLTPVSSRIDPHLTLKAPFETEDPSAVETIIETFVENETSNPLTLIGFHDLNKKVIYMGVEAPKQTHMLIRRLQDKLRGVSWLSFSASEFPITLHATLCYAKNREQGKEIHSYLSHEKPASFELFLDNVTLLCKKGARWEAVRAFHIE